MSGTKTLLSAAVIALAAVSATALASLMVFAPEVDADRLLTEASEQQTVIKTYTYVVSSGQTPQTDDDPGIFTSTVTGYVVADEGVYLKVKTTLGYVEYLILPDNQYERYGPDEIWIKSSGSSSGFVLPELDSSKHSNLVRNLDDLQVAGEEVFRGVKVTKVTARIDLDRKAEKTWGDIEKMSEEVRKGVDSPRKQMLAGEEEFAALIGKSDGLIYQYSTSGSYPAYGDLKAYESWETVTFSDFNEPFELPPAPDTDTGMSGDDDSGTDSPDEPTGTPEPSPVPTGTPLPAPTAAPTPTP